MKKRKRERGQRDGENEEIRRTVAISYRRVLYSRQLVQSFRSICLFNIKVQL
jgi:hypothetical protein